MPRKRSRYNNRQKKNSFQNSTTRELQPVLGYIQTPNELNEENNARGCTIDENISDPLATTLKVEENSAQTQQDSTNNVAVAPSSIEVDKTLVPDLSQAHTLDTQEDSISDVCVSTMATKTHTPTHSTNILADIPADMNSDKLVLKDENETSENFGSNNISGNKPDIKSDVAMQSSVSEVSNSNPLMCDTMATIKNQHSVTDQLNNTDSSEISLESKDIIFPYQRSISLTDSRDDLFGSGEFSPDVEDSDLTFSFESVVSEVEIKTLDIRDNKSFVESPTAVGNEQTKSIFHESSIESDKNSFFDLNTAHSSRKKMEGGQRTLEDLHREVRFLRNENALYKEQIHRMQVPEKIKMLYRQLFSKKRKLKELEEKLVAESAEKEKVIEKLKESNPKSGGEKSCGRCEILLRELKHRESTNEKLDDISMAYDKLESKLNNCRVDNEMLSAKVNTQNGRIKDLQRNERELCEKIETLGTASKEREARLQMYKLQYNTAKEELNILQNKNKDLSFRISQINVKDNISIYKKQFIDVNNQLKNSQSKLQAAELTVSTLGNQLKDSKRMQETLHMEKNRLQQRLDEISTLNSKITSNNSEFHRVMKEQISKTKELEQKLKQKADEASRVRHEMKQAETQVNEENVKELREYKEQLDIECSKNAENEKVIKKLKQKLESANNDINSFAKEKNELNKQIDLLNIVNENLRTENLNLINSTDSEQNGMASKNDEFFKLKNEKENLNLYLDEILDERKLASSTKCNNTLLDKLQAICVQLNRIEWRKTNAENKIETLESQVRKLKAKNVELKGLNDTNLRDKEDFLALLEKQNMEIKQLRSGVKESGSDSGNFSENETSEYEALRKENDCLKANCENLNDLLESMVVENQELKAKYLELGLTGFPLISPPVYNDKVDESNLKHDTVDYRKLYEDAHEEISNLKECVKKYRTEVESISDLLESVVVENRRLKLSQWNDETNC